MARVAILFMLITVFSGCAAPHAVRVRCDRHLTPINALQPGPLRSVRP